MMDPQERAVLFKSLAGAVKEYFATGIRAFVERLDAVEKLLMELPAPKDGERGEKGDKGEPGVSPDEKMIVGRVMEMMPLSSMKKEVLDAVVEAMPKPKDGTNGIDGLPGERGEKGEKGDPGVDGRQGERGDKGDSGVNGKDADPEMIRQMVTDGLSEEKLRAIILPAITECLQNNTRDVFSTIVESVVAKIPKPKDGEPGKDGKDPEPIHPDTVELMVRKAVDAMPKPKDGDKGDPGRDMIHLDILPAVDFDKSYPRGTVAIHAGGLIHAFRDTIPGKQLAEGGWQVILNGTADESYQQDADGRTLTFVRVWTNGEVRKTTFAVPTQVYRGVWKVGNVYTRADTVTKGGNQFYCIAESSSIAPDTPNNKDWVLSVRAGRDGKSYEPPMDKPEPKPLALR